MTFSKVALPKEHGAWGFVLEPLLFSLLVAFTLDGLLLALAMFFMFLSSQPFKLITAKLTPKKLQLAARVALLFYFSISIVFFVVLIIGANFNSLIPFYTALIVLIIYKVAEYNSLSRNLFVELLPIFSMTLVSISIVMIDTSFSINPIVFGILLLSRAVPTVFYINAKVKWVKGFKFSVLPTHLLNVGFLLLVIYACLNNFLPLLSILGSVLLTIRAIIGFSKFSFTKTVK